MKLAEALKITQSHVHADAPPFRVILACGFEPLHLKTFLHAHLLRLLPNRRIIVSTGLYGSLADNLQRARQETCEAVAIAMEWQDFDPRLGVRGVGGWTPASLPDIAQNAQTRAAQFLQLIKDVASTIPLVISLPTLPIPPVSYHAQRQLGDFEIALQKITHSIAEQMAVIPFIKLANPQSLLFQSPLPDRLDVKSEIVSGFPYTLAHASALAEMLALLISPPAPKKGLVTDLDDTLWRGILGEDGVQGISWDIDRKTHIHALYQQLLAALAETGILLAAATKNNPAFVEEAFQRKDILIKRERLFPLEANWGLKTQSMERILKAWNIGEESAVFVDDSPIEIDLMKSAFPSMECLLFPTHDEKGVWQLMRRLRDLFGRERLQEEDRIRAASLNRNAEQGESNQGIALSEDILKNAGAEIAMRFVKDPLDARAFELVNKTNQFNLNSRRFTEGEWQAALARKDGFLLTAAYSDKYGPLGKIAVLMGIRKEGRVVVETWVMSCRAFSRRIEHQCLEYLFQKTGVEEIEFQFQPTSRNQPLQEFFASIIGESPTGPFALDRALFVEKCPPLYHTIREA